uniref:Uncharacterized protein n=1 Tax=Romanomermis culicivorax TaxID=13658 RepID=A0A915KN38_ROMCU
MCDVIGVGIVRSNPWIVNDHKTSKSSTLTSPTTPVNRTPTPKFFTKEETTFFDDDQFPIKKGGVLNSDLLPYGPGFVQKLRERYLKLLVSEGILTSGDNLYHNNDGKTGRVSKNMYNRRTASCDELSSDSVADDHVRHLKVAKTTSNYQEHNQTRKTSRVGFKSSEDLSKSPISPTIEFPSDIVKPSHSISELKERFESRSKEDEKMTKIVDTVPIKQRSSVIAAAESTKKAQDSPPKKHRALANDDLLQQKQLSVNHEDSSSSKELEFLKVAKKLKHINAVDNDKVSNDVEPKSLICPPYTESKKHDAKPCGPKRSAPIPASRSSITKNVDSMSDDELFKYFFTVASYDGNGQSSSMPSPTINNSDCAPNMNSDSADGVIFRFK